MIFERQCWQYDYAKPTSGRTLWLLSPDEFSSAKELLLNVLNTKFYLSRQQYFTRNEVLSFSAREKLITDIRKQIKLIEIDLSKKMDISLLIYTMNQDINALFSDDGWRYIRKELNQRAKRSRKSHIEISNHLVVKIKSYMKSNGLNTYDDALEIMFESLDELAEVKAKSSKESLF